MESPSTLDIWAVIAVPGGTIEDRLTRHGHTSLGHMLATAMEIFPAHHIVVVSADDAALAKARQARARAIRGDAQADIYDALTQGALFAAERGAEAILSLTSDLPLLKASNLRAILGAFDGTNIVIAMDEPSTSCDASLLQPDCLLYGHDKIGIWAKLASIREAGSSFTIVSRDGLMHDIVGAASG